MADTVTYTDLNEFLTMFYMHKTFLDMPEAQFQTYVDYLKGNDGTGDFTGNMKKWHKNRFVIQNADGEWVRNKCLPGEIDNTLVPPKKNFDLDNDAWEELYLELRQGFRKLSYDIAKAGTDSDIFENDLKNFVQDYYEPGDIFGPYAIPASTKDTLQHSFLDALRDNKNLIQSLVKKDIIKDFDALLGNIQSGNFTENVRLQLISLIDKIRDQMLWGGETAAKEQLEHIFSGIDLDQLLTGLNAENEPIDQRKLDHFKVRFNSFLHDASKTKVIKQFKNYAPSISTSIDAAKEKVDYNNPQSEDYLAPKRDDKLSPWQKFTDDVGKTWHDHMDKYTKLHGGHVFFSPQSKAICDALDKAKYNSTGGLAKLLEDKDKIKDNIKSPTAKKQFDWMIGALDKLKKKKMFAGALKNATQMKALVSQLAIMALEDDARNGNNNGKDAVKTVMEVLTVIRYGYTTSNILDTLKKQDVKIFSDSNLSWNNNEGIQFVTKALDKSIEYAFLGLGYAINATGHLIKTRNKKIDDKEQNAFQRAAQQKKDDDYTRRLNELRQQQYNNDIALLDNIDILNDLETHHGINRANADILEANKQHAKDLAEDDFNTKNTEYEKRKTRLEHAQQIIATEPTLIRSTVNKINALNVTIADLNARIAPLNLPNPTPEQDFEVKKLLEQRSEAETKLAELQKNLTQSQKRLAAARTSVGERQNKFNTAEANKNTSEHDLRTATDDYNDFSGLKEQFDSAKELVDELTDDNAQIDIRIGNIERDHAADNHDQYLELMKHWNFLQSGQSRHGESLLEQIQNATPFASQKTRQQKYNANKQRLYADFMSR